MLGFLFFFFLVVPGAEGIDVVWAPSGYAGGGRYTVVALDPFHGNNVLVGSDVAGVFRSSDGGESFFPSSKGLTGFAVADIAFSPHREGVVILLADDGLYADTHGGEGWSIISGAVRYKKRCCTGHLVAYGRDVAYLGSDSGVFTADLGQEPWSVRPVPGLENVPVNAVALHDGTLFVATDQGVFQRRGAWVSANEGFPAQGRPRVTDLVAGTDGHLYAVEQDSGLYEWEGGQWLPRPVGSVLANIYKARVFKTLAVDPRDSSHVIMATHPEVWPHRLLCSSNRGSSWDLLDNFQIHPKAPKNWASAPHAIESLAFSPRDPQTIFLTDWWNVWKSADGGAFWSSCHSGLQNTVVNDLKQNPGNGAYLYAAVADNGLMVSCDGGQTWERRMRGLPDGHAQEVEISGMNPSKMYLLLNPWQTDPGRIYVFRSLDGGASWHDVSFRAATTMHPQFNYITGEATNLEIDPESDDIVYVATNGYGIYRTVNGGRSWMPIHAGLPCACVKGAQGLTAVRGSPGLLYVSTLNGGIYKSTNRGDLWQKLDLAEPMTFGLAVHGGEGKVRIAVGCPNKRIAVSRDGGESWQIRDLPGERPGHVTASVLTFDPHDQDTLVVATAAYDFKAADGLFISRDSGATFERLPMPANLPRVSVFSMLYTSHNSLYVGFNGLGVYKVQWN